MNRTLAACAAAALAPVAATAQPTFLINDRVNDTIWRLADLDQDGVIEPPAELRVWFDATNAAGTPGLSNPSALGARPTGSAIVGDQGLAAILAFDDINLDGDAQDPGESRVLADLTNASAAAIAFPVGAAFDPGQRLYIVNAGNASGPDAVYRLDDLTGDGDCQDPGEIAVFIGDGAFGPGNGPYSPQELLFATISPVSGYLRNSSTGLHGVYRFADMNGSGRADDPGEFTAFFTSSNQSGITPAAGFALEHDAARPGSIYLLQTGAGSLDQLIRLTDGNNNLTANDPGEAVVAWESAEPDFINIDAASLPDGRVFITDSDADRVIVLRDTDGDQRFMSAGERSDFYLNTPATIGDVRQIAPIPWACYPDCNDSGTLTVADFGCFQTWFAFGKPYTDCNRDGLQNVADFGCFQTRFVQGCP